MNNKLLVDVDTNLKPQSENNITKNQKKQRNRSKKSKNVLSALSNDANAIKDLNNTTTAEITKSDQQASSSNNKTKKKNKKKKTKSTSTIQNELKTVENLVSKTFQNRKDNQQEISASSSPNNVVSGQVVNEGINELNNSELNYLLANQKKSSFSNDIIVEEKNQINIRKTNEKNANQSVESSQINIVLKKMDKELKTISNEKSREEIVAERKAKKFAKQMVKYKTKNTPSASDLNETKNSIEKSVKEAIIVTKTECDLSQPEDNIGEIGSELNDASVKNESSNSVKTKMTLFEKSSSPSASAQKTKNKSQEEILSGREEKRLAKQAVKIRKQESASAQEKLLLIKNKSASEVTRNSAVETVYKEKFQISQSSEIKKKPETTKAERRAIQEAQRAAKAKILENKQQQKQQILNNSVKQTAIKIEEKTIENKATIAIDRISEGLTPRLDFKVKLFNHLYGKTKEQSLFVNNSTIHPSMVRLGEQYATRTVVGSNARCIAFLNALKTMISGFKTPQNTEFRRELESSIKNCINYLNNCRPLAVSMMNANKYIKFLLTQLSNDKSETELKDRLIQHIDIYIKEQIDKAAQAINAAVQEKISDGDVILTYGCSSLINYILEQALQHNISFRVICVDSRPFMEGQEMLRRLCAKGIPCTYVLINAVSFIMAKVTKVLLGAHSILANGYVMSRTGTAQVALIARSYNVPVLVCCETHKFSERVQTDAIVYNELGNPDDVVKTSSETLLLTNEFDNNNCNYFNDDNSNNNSNLKQNDATQSFSSNCLKDWRMYGKLTPLNLNYDITPPELVTAVVTEVAILPCTSVPVILRIKPSEIGY